MNRILLLALLAFLLPLCQRAHACSIPVFRYALERWELGPYEVLLFQRGPITDPADKALLNRLESPSPKANATLTTVDLSRKVDAAHQALFDRLPKGARLPHLVVRNLAPDRKDTPVWSGPLSTANVEMLLASPARSRLVRHLSQGDSAVFILLESGDAKADRAAAELLDRELAALAKKVELPEQTADGPQIRYPLPLRVSFPVVTVSRSAPEEQLFVRMLLSSEEGLNPSEGPIVFPIFGRGRLLCSLQGKELSGEQLTNVIRFLCGACSCQVKELNPGVDLLVSAEWVSLLENSELTAVLADQLTYPVMRGLKYLTLGGRHLESSYRDLDAALVKMLPKTEVSVAAPVESPPACKSEQPGCQVRRGCGSCGGDGTRIWLWSGAGGALLLVLATGMWAGRVH